MKKNKSRVSINVIMRAARKLRRRKAALRAEALANGSRPIKSFKQFVEARRSGAARSKLPVT